MEENKLDKKSLVGFALLFVIIAWMFYNAQPTEKEIAAEKAKKAQTEKAAALTKAKSMQVANTTEIVATKANDTLQNAKLKETLGNFAYSASLPTAKEGFTTLENDLVILKIANKGGFVVEATLKKFEKFKNCLEMLDLKRRAQRLKRLIACLRVIPKKLFCR